FAKPVIAAAHGGLIEIVMHGKTGLLVKPNDPTALRSALSQLANDVDLRQRLGTAGQARQRDLFSVQGYVTRLSQLLGTAAAETSKTILFVHQSAEMYGSDKVLLWLAMGVQAHGFHAIVLLPSEGPLFDTLMAGGIEVHVAEVTKLNRESLSLSGLLKLPGNIYRSIRDKNRIVAGRKIDLVYSNTLAVLGGAICARFKRIPHLWHVHELLESPAVVRKGFPLMVRMLSDKVVTNSTLTTRWLLQEQSALARKTLTIWNGLGQRPAVNEREADAIRALLGVQNGQLLVALVGRINRWKGQELLIEAATDLWIKGTKHVHFVMVGGVAPGQEHLIEALKARIASSPASAQIHHLDFRDDVWSVWDACDIAVVPSTEPEPFGMVAIEAMAAGKPVIVAGHGGLLDIVEDGVSGLIFKPGDVQAFAQQLDRLINAPTLRSDLGARGRIRQKQLFSLETQLKRTLELINSMTSKT
ncbi:MAG: glycosyltransferase, partial [Candidatus Saccharibacteria bacterium]|nr:glycosyltransferase [Rhodoferax sp.]